MSKEPVSETQQISFLSEVARKATHTGALIIPGGYYLLNVEKHDMLIIMGIALLLMLFIDISRIRNWPFWTKGSKKILAPIIRKHEYDGDFTGATYILLSIFLTVLFFSKPIAIAALAFIMVGDSFAALIGRKFGKHKIFKNKSVEGSLGCLLGTMIVAVFAPNLTIYVASFGAVVAAVVEALPLKLDDNLTVPLISGAAMMVFEKILLFS